ncbi:MAG TPA: HAMP domain-containing sensor histidine kinase [Gemmatimonadaceae bacterium]|nr:HAMP domain-containing sensor histidine kinase [Gemmatimonadaceae bacterium]
MRRSPRLVGTVALLVLALVVCAALTYQAWDAARSQRAMAERTLQDYAKIADWQLTQQAKNALLKQVVASLIQQAMRLQPDSLERTLYSPADVGAIAHDMMMGWCNCLDSVRYFFRYDWKDSTFRTTETDVSDSDLARVRDTMVAYVSDMPPLPSDRGVLNFVTPNGRAMPGVMLTNDSYVMLFDEHNKHLQLVVFVVARDVRRRRPVELYGYVTEPKPFLDPVFEEIRGKRGNASSLLPEALIHDLPIDSILSISVTTAKGTEVYHSPGWIATTYSAASTVDPSFGRLKMRVSLNKAFAPQLVVGGLPDSRLPILVALFVLAAGLLTVAVVQLRRQQQLARLRTEFVSGVSHELRTPLAQIRWFAELLHLGRLRTDDERERSAGIIDQEARRLTYLVENVLNFSRAEKGTNRVSPEPAEVDREIQESLDLFAPLARSRGMTINAALGINALMSVDRNALRQILLNLLDNAAKYGPSGQTITVGSQVVGDRARIWVEDEGPGIPRDDRVRVWEPYVRLNRDAESSTGGSGIGLSVVRELVLLHGGRTRVESAPGGGARVVIELPLTQSEPSDSASPTSPSSSDQSQPPPPPNSQLQVVP